MKSLYLILDLLTLFFPVVLSFDKKIGFIKSWKNTFLASLIVGIPFILWDIFFTQKGFWGFNPDYLLGINVFNLPLEEILFFLVVPFACIFIYQCVKGYFAQFKSARFNSIFYAGIALYMIFIFFSGKSGAYSISVIVSSTITLFLIFRFLKETAYLPLAFLISLIPFLIVNGALTGSFTDAPVVWYNDLERSPFRIFTIPVEDILYSFTLIGLNIYIFEKLNSTEHKITQ